MPFNRANFHIENAHQADSLPGLGPTKSSREFGRCGEDEAHKGNPLLSEREA